jgi:hypothetical protein
MIDTVLTLLQQELLNYLEPIDPSATVTVDNVALLETTNGDKLANSIVLTVVNVEEESTLKNQPAVYRNPALSIATYQNPPVYLNLYVLITCNYWGDNYIYALKRLSYVVRFVQGKPSFSYGTASYSGANDNEFTTDPDLLGMQFTLELYTLTFEQLNHLWGSLGGRQVPFVMYKLRLVALTDRRTLRQVPLIREIDTDVVSTTKFSR